MFSDICELIKAIETGDGIGQIMHTEKMREVFCKVKPVQQSEFFKAGQSGLKAALCLVVSVHEYDGETALLFDGERYAVYRTYQKGEMMELYCEVRSGE